MPANDGIRHRVGRSKIGLDVEERRVVEAVDTNNVKRIAFDPDKPRHRNRDWVRPRRRSQREGAALLAVVPRHLQHQIAASTIHPIEQENVGDGLKPLKSLRPARIEFDDADRVGFARVLWTLRAALPGCADSPDEIERSVELFRRRDGDLALTQREEIVAARGIRALAGFAFDHSRTVARGGEDRHRGREKDLSRPLPAAAWESSLLPPTA